MSSSVYSQLKQAILDGEMPSGQPLVETALAETYGVSRTPVREALHRLQQDGIVERGDRGLRVAERSAEQIFEIYEARIVLEAAVCEAAARRRTEIDVARLHGQLESAPPGDVSGAELVAANQRFHEAVWQASHNRTLLDLLRRLEVHLRRYPSTTLTFPGRWEEAVAEHRELVAAIEAHDTEAAAHIGRAHMTRARDVRLRMWREQEMAAPDAVVG
ncbi:MAG TPA: GntR family transcriptional regulator [Capillimicrobium sp.]|jgi:DNA-binding GntR family transcriptional regulator